jgi:hypothetical protein
LIECLPFEVEAISEEAIGFIFEVMDSSFWVLGLDWMGEIAKTSLHWDWPFLLRFILPIRLPLSLI